MLNKKTITEIFNRFLFQNKNPKIELNYVNNYTLLVAVVLSAQSTDIRVNIVTKSLFKTINNPKKMLSLGEKKLKKKIKSIGLYNAKSKNIIDLSQKLIKDNYNDDIPCDFNYLLSLPGVGRKSANVILNSAFGKPTIGVDTHVFRVSNRIGLTESKNVLQTEKQLTAIIPEKFLRNTHHWLVLHGRYICTAKKPKCEKCYINDLCKYANTKLVNS